MCYSCFLLGSNLFFPPQIMSCQDNMAFDSETGNCSAASLSQCRLMLLLKTETRIPMLLIRLVAGRTFRSKATIYCSVKERMSQRSLQPFRCFIQLSILVTHEMQALVLKAQLSTMMKYLEFSVVGFITFNRKSGMAINKLCTTKAYHKSCMDSVRISVAS